MLLTARIEKLIALKETQGGPEHKDIPFLTSIKEWFEKTGKLSDKQLAAFYRIEHLSSPAGQKELEDWHEAYAARHRTRASVCATYYLANPPYFADLASNILSNPDFVPTKRQFEAMCMNKYTSRVWAEYERPAAYAAGDIVQVRNIAAAPFRIRNQLCVVVENSCGVTTHAIGGKIYRLLPFGTTVMVECQERYIKKFKRSKTLEKGDKHA